MDLIIVLGSKVRGTEIHEELKGRLDTLRVASTPIRTYTTGYAIH